MRSGFFHSFLGEFHKGGSHLMYSVLLMTSPDCVSVATSCTIPVIEGVSSAVNATSAGEIFGVKDFEASKSFCNCFRASGARMGGNVGSSGAGVIAFK